MADAPVRRGVSGLRRGARDPRGASGLSGGPGAPGRSRWGSSFGFVMAAAGSAVGLGNLWRFPYITGENGGGLFVVIYLLAIGLVGLPILLSEIVIGRAGQSSAATALRTLAGRRTRWAGLGLLGAIGASGVLSAYAVVAGWALHYTVLSIRGSLSGLGAEEVQALFGGVFTSTPLNLFWSLAFLALTMAVVLGGVRKGIERWSRVLMPLLALMLLVLLARAVTLDGFGEAFRFVFGLHAERLSPAGVLEAVGHAFFTLGVGVGVMAAYGSYLDRDADIVRDGLAVATLDTAFALVACLVVFPITFSFGMEAAEGPGLVFVSLPIAFAQLPAGSLLASAFFALLTFAALTSSISILEVPTAYFIDERGWSRRRATWTAGALIALASIPAALTGTTVLFGSGWESVVGKNWFDMVLDTVSNWIQPLGGLGFAVFVAWKLDDVRRRAQFPPTLAGGLYRGWLLVLRYFVPVAVVAVFLQAVGLF